MGPRNFWLRKSISIIFGFLESLEVAVTVIGVFRSFRSTDVYFRSRFPKFRSIFDVFEKAFFSKFFDFFSKNCRFPKFCSIFDVFEKAFFSKKFEFFRCNVGARRSKVFSLLDLYNYSVLGGIRSQREGSRGADQKERKQGRLNSI